MWANEFGAGADDPHFDDEYGANEVIARDLVNRAIDDWNSIILDQNWDNDDDPETTPDYQLTVIAVDFVALDPNLAGVRGNTNPTAFTNGIPTAATINLDDNGGGTGWFFDQTPLDDAEFTGIASAFQASFIDGSVAGQAAFNDFYRTILHEIGHALGILIIDGVELNSGNWLIQNQDTAQFYSLPTDTTDDLLGNLTYVGVDQVNPARTVTLFDPNTGQFDPFTVINELWEYDLAGIGTVTFTEEGGGHFYEGPVDPNFAGAAIHPNDLMNAGRTVPPPLGNPIPTTRQFISDVDVQVLADAYGYTVVLPSALDTAHATLDSQTGTLLVQGRTGALNDTITIDTVGGDLRVQVNNTTELVPFADVSQIVIAGNGGTDAITVAPSLSLLRKDVDYVVSSNEDSADAGTLGDGLVDLDANVPGNQVALRAAVRDANGGAMDAGCVFALAA